MHGKKNSISIYLFCKEQRPLITYLFSVILIFFNVNYVITEMSQRIVKKSSRIIGYISIVMMMAACEKDISIDIPVSQPQYVVEGYVEPGTNPYVLLTKTAPYTSSTDQSSLSKIVVKDPIVIMSDGSITDTIEQVDGLSSLLYVSTKIVGAVGRNYTLTIILPGNKILTAQTTIPQPVVLDSVAFRYLQTVDSTGYLWVRFTDPASQNNYYRTFTRNKQHQFGTSTFSVFSDKFFNGMTYEYTLENGKVTTDPANDDDRMYTIGDSVEIKFCTMTKAGYEFWRQAEAQVANNGNPFSSSAVLPSNIDGGIGIFEGYSPTYYKVVVGKP